MRRTDRLFQIIQILRGAQNPVTARSLAEELETTQRTIYRDISELMVQQIPIRGEAGIGYVLDKGYDMPPLMLSLHEIEAAILGAQLVASRGDPSLVRGARDLIAKISAVLPERLRPLIIENSLVAPNAALRAPDAIDMVRLRDWIRSQGKIRIHYCDDSGKDSIRVIWPIALAYFETVRLIVAWCELREGIRHFRTDRISEADFLEERYSTPASALRAAWRQ